MPHTIYTGLLGHSRVTPNSQKWWSKKANVIPRGLAWSKVTMFEKSDYDRLFGPLSIPNVALILSPEEMRQTWFMASVEFIQGLAHQDDSFLQDDEARGNCIEHHNGMCGDTEDGDGVHLSQTNDVIQQAVNLSTMLSTSLQARNAVVAEFFAEFYALKKQVLLIKKRKDDEFDELTKRFKVRDLQNFYHNDTSNHIGGVSTKAKHPSSSSSHPGNDEDASHLDDLMEIDVENANDDYSNSQHHLHLLIKALDSKTENPTIDVVVPPKDNDHILCTIKPNDACDEVKVDNFEDDDKYGYIKNHKKTVKNGQARTRESEEYKKKPKNQSRSQKSQASVKEKSIMGILEQQPNAAKGKTIVLKETVMVKVEENPSLGRGLGPLKVKKKSCQWALRPNYVLRSAQIRKKKLAMALKSLFGQQSATTPAPKKIKSRIPKTEVIVPPFVLE
ncbi:hypothetical protein Tco_1050801, partial [Tanacetum coccineum]